MTGPSEFPAQLAPPMRQVGRIRLRTLVLMRWIAVMGQTATILIVNFVLEYDLPLAWTLATIGASAALNAHLTWRHPVSRRLGDAEAGLYLAYDTLQLAVLLFLTGGLHNPFSFLMLAGAVVSAAVLSVRTTVWIVGLILGCVSILVFFHLPLPGPGGQEAGDSILHLYVLVSGPGGRHPIDHVYVFGIWSALVVGMVFFAANVARVAEEGRRVADALMETQMVLAREQRLSAVGGLAAAVAHELGTPLGTIAVIAKELSRDVPADSPHSEDVRLLLSQSERCREILARLSLRPADGDGPSFHRLPFMTLVEMATGLRRREGVDVTVEHVTGLARAGSGGGEPGNGQILPQPLVPDGLEIIHGLQSLIENAVDFARTQVWIKGDWSDRTVVVEISDDGPGIARDILGALGEPYVSTRRDAGGMGLGVFIAKTLLERTGAEIEFGNREEGGARVTIVWPRFALPANPAIADEGRPTVGPKVPQ